MSRTAAPVFALLLSTLPLPSAASPSDIPSPPASPLADAEIWSGFDWRMIGPHRGGRVTAVAGVVQQRETFYMGATGGGVWKTDDLGMTWRNLSDGFFATGSIGALDVADSDPNVVWAGTGSACIRSNVITGRGVYRSTDAGDSWQLVGLRDAGQIGDLVIHPDDPDTVWVAALGHPFGPNDERGVYRTQDGGVTWERVLFVSDRVGAVDLAVDPHNPRHLFAAMWRGERKPWTITSGSEDSGLYRSRDGGATWQRLTDGLPAGLVGKIAVEVSPADPSRVWALVEAPGEERGLYRSDDGGASFRFVNGQTSLTYRPFYYMHLTADPKSPDKLYVNNETLWVTVDGGESFEALATPHGDNHAMWIHPDDPELMVQGNDGGANVSWNGGRTWSPQWNQPTAELYQVAVDESFPYRVYGAQQDNTTISVPSRVSRRPLDPKQDWLEVSGCETGPVVPDPADPNRVYGGCKGRHSVFDVRTGQVQEYWVYPHFNYGHDTREMPYRFQRTAPLIVSPHDSSVLYHGSHVVHRSRDGGASWEVISPDLTAFDDETQGYSGEPITRDITGEEIYSAVYAIAESPHDRGELWVGSNDGPIHLSRDGGDSWQEVTPDDLPPGGRVNRIEPSPHVAGRAYVAVYRFQLDDWRPYVYRTDDRGRSWRLLTDGSNGIPADVPVRVVREDPEREGLLYAGTEFGLYLSFDGGERWQPFQLDLPVTPITDLVVHRGDLVLSTMGRSFWILDDLSPLRQADAETLSEPAWLFTPRPAERVRWVGSLERSFPGYAPEYPETGAVLDYWLDGEADGPVVLEILGADGAVLRRFASDAEETAAAGSADQGMRGPVETEATPQLAAERGVQRFRWDLRLPGPRSVDDPAERGRGPMALPGRYRVRLRVAEHQIERPLELVMDPRLAEVGVTEEDLTVQFELASSIVDRLDQLALAVERSRDLRGQIEAAAERAEAAAVDPDGRIAELAATLGDRLVEIEELLVQVEEGKVGAELEPQLRSQLTYLYGMVIASDQRPGRDAHERFADIERELEEVLSRLEAVIEGELAEFVALVAERQVPPVVAGG